MKKITKNFLKGLTKKLENSEFSRVNTLEEYLRVQKVPVWFFSYIVDDELHISIRGLN